MRVGFVSLALVLVLGGCGATEHRAALTADAPPLATTCGGLPGGLAAKSYWLETSDGVRIYAAAAGSGPTAVVLVHESGGGICSLLSELQWLASRRLRPVAISLRGYPPSAEPRDAIYHHYTNDLQAAVDAAHALGARRVFVMGASLGGAATVAAAPALQRTAGVISLSGELQLPMSEIDAVGAAPHIKLPVLLVGSQDDLYLDGAAAHRLYRAVGSKDKQVAVFVGGSHGYALIQDWPIEKQARALILGWISAHS